MIGKKSMLHVAAVAAVLASTGWASAKTVCYVTAADSHAYATPANKALQARAAELGIKILSLSQDFDVQKGTEQLNTCVARKVDGIILWPLDPQAYIPGLARAQQANIPAILINSPMSDDAKPFIKSFTGPDVYEEGKLAADSLSKALGGKGSVVIIAGQAGNGTTIGRVSGFTDRLKETNADIKVLDTVNADFDQQNLITRFGDQISGVYANDDTMARGFIDAWKEANPSKAAPPIVGINGQKDAFESIRTNEMYSTIVQSPVEDGRLAINTMAEIIDGKQVKDRLPIPLTVVTKDNVNAVEPAF
ncbi:sugar ABC transporter substrate-binding protein [Mesorhizobium sp. M7A.F.Ca.MR.245.00.0.0]|uniref:sugar ABC transporter substrate-binding protein n=1 Tax=Mesorhizobium sp. M7A.F.Ca.MR.245.00.0.0 TaxID=2496778 RepID=UPI000FCA8142|nr:sugar ABC transporter substrate-binding protein [Mesorhizobium sp. M7A.F.Ca.MR.245.00.0.0]RUV19792.1 ribose ABC transporter substrate-binding protein [Mesorhizobium sp. M7A.F.Ca.MR.245.00.0.0]RUV49773.1 ribose ABC transporter substrate-binding protein [Mesorhizobium sp. M7A.F.Ca.MR.228.00.0.0]